MHQKVNVLIFLIYAQKGQFWRKKINLTILLSSLALLLSLLVFTCFHLNFSNMLQWRRGERRLILLLGLYMFLYMLVKHVVDIQTLILQGEWEKFAILSLVYENMGIKRGTYGVKNGCTDL